MNLSAIRRRENCRLCQSPALELALPMQPSPIGDAYITEKELSIPQASYPLSLHLCKHCGHLQALDVVDPNILFGNYIYSTATSPGLVDHFKQYAKEIITCANAANGSLVIEIGSNDGSLLQAFKNQGMKVLGIDPAKDIAVQADHKGLETIPTFFTFELAKQIKQKYGVANIIAANNVFAHVDDLADMLQGIHHLLAPEGIFVFEVSYLLDMIQKNVFDTIYHEHVCHHRIAPLETFFNRYGLQLFDVQRIATKGGSIRGYVKLIGSKRTVSATVKEHITTESEMQLDKVETYQKFAKHLDSIKSDLLQILDTFKAKDQIIAGFGASTPVTTTIYQFELGPYLSYLFDDNPIKQGRFSPGHHIPVISSEYIYEKKPACIIILAWQYAPMIMKKHNQYLKNGGQFIVPLPQVEVINHFNDAG